MWVVFVCVSVYMYWSGGGNASVWRWVSLIYARNESFKLSRINFKREAHTYLSFVNKNNNNNTNVTVFTKHFPMSYCVCYGVVHSPHESVYFVFVYKMERYGLVAKFVSSTVKHFPILSSNVQYTNTG